MLIELMTQAYQQGLIPSEDELRELYISNNILDAPAVIKKLSSNPKMKQVLPTIRQCIEGVDDQQIGTDIITFMDDVYPTLTTEIVEEKGQWIADLLTEGIKVVKDV